MTYTVCLVQCIKSLCNTVVLVSGPPYDVYDLRYSNLKMQTRVTAKADIEPLLYVCDVCV